MHLDYHSAMQYSIIYTQKKKKYGSRVFIRQFLDVFNDFGPVSDTSDFVAGQKLVSMFILPPFVPIFKFQALVES